MSAAARERSERAQRTSAQKSETKSPHHEAENAVNFIKDSSMIGVGVEGAEMTVPHVVRAIF
jgi:hypothetical protein